jgi:predicted restriction endonuclease
MNALHDKAFDKGLISITPDFSVIVARQIVNHSEPEFRLINQFHGKPIEKPTRFLPDLDLLEYHRDMIFQG